MNDDNNMGSTGYTADEDEDEVMTGTNRDMGDSSLEESDDIERDDSM